jgi:hypothetical protein
VELVGLEQSLITDEEGFVNFVVPQGQWLVKVSRDGMTGERAIEVLLNSMSIQRLDLVVFNGLVLDLWKSVLFVGLIIVTCVFLLFLLHKKLIAGLMQS